MLKNFTPNNEIREAITHANGVAAQTTINGAALDFQGWLGGVVAVLKLGSIAANAVTSLKWQASDDSGTTYKDLIGTKVDIAADADNEYIVSEIYFPRYRHMRIVVERETADATVDSAVYILCGPRKARLTYGDEFHVNISISPDFGDA
jgi:hypothetical protein